MPSANELRFPSIEGLRAFEAAARLGTFERAADELSVTASAIGKRIATVEELIGTPLFSRSGKSLQLTAAGQEYLEQVRAALGLLSAMPQHRRTAQQAQKLRISAPPTFARAILVPQLESFTASHPEVELEIVLSIPFVNVQAGESDLEIRNGDPAGFAGRVLMRDVVCPMIAPGLLASLPPLRTPADLAHAPLLRTPLEPWVPWFRAAGLDWPEPATGPKLLDLGMTLEAAVSGQGVALARPVLAHRWLMAGSLKPLFGLTAPAVNPYFVVVCTESDAAKTFADWLQDRCTRLAAEALELLSART